MFRWGNFTWAAASILALSGSALGVTLGYNQTLTLPGTTLAQRPDLTGTSLAPNTSTELNQTSPSDTSFDESQIAFDALRRTDGGLDFTYQARNLSTNDQPMTWSLTVAGLPYETLDTDVLTDSPGTSATITASRDGNGVVTYTPSTALAAGQTSQTIVIAIPWATQFYQTSLLSFSTDFANDPAMSGGAVYGYAPIPEPLTMTLLAMATGALLLRRPRLHI